MLYIVATPIGNLEDITQRAINVLKSCDYILCEDTRHSRHLLDRYEINLPLKSFHKFNEASKEEPILSDLQNGKTIGLISDAGTPGISDPGTRLIKACIDNGIEVCSIPGPCAAVVALSSSGLNTDRFQFIGFLPKKEKALRKCFQECLLYPGTTICYESPNRLTEALDQLKELAPTQAVVVARELTKLHEEVKRGTAEEVASYYTENPPRGEIVLLIAGKQENAENERESAEWSEWSPIEHVKHLMETYSMTRQEAIKMVADMRGVPKRNIYNEVERQKEFIRETDNNDDKKNC